VFLFELVPVTVSITGHKNPTGEHRCLFASGHQRPSMDNVQALTWPGAILMSFGVRCLQFALEWSQSCGKRTASLAVVSSFSMANSGLHAGLLKSIRWCCYE
jgi:hypothetical protein